MLICWLVCLDWNEADLERDSWSWYCKKQIVFWSWFIQNSWTETSLSTISSYLTTWTARAAWAWFMLLQVGEESSLAVSTARKVYDYIRPSNILLNLNSRMKNKAGDMSIETYSESSDRKHGRQIDIETRGFNQCDFSCLIKLSGCQKCLVLRVILIHELIETHQFSILTTLSTQYYTTAPPSCPSTTTNSTSTF